jgi:hypothetical protein
VSSGLDRKSAVAEDFDIEQFVYIQIPEAMQPVDRATLFDGKGQSKLLTESRQVRSPFARRDDEHGRLSRQPMFVTPQAWSENLRD